MSAQDSKIVEVPMVAQRSLATVTAEIRAYQDAARRVVLSYSIEIGRRLVEAKSMVGHGEWGTYLQEELGFSQSTANNHMRLFEAYGAAQMTMTGAAVKSQAFADLSYTQALALLALPSDEAREAFVEDHDMGAISTRELQAEIARLKEEAKAKETEMAHTVRRYKEEAAAAEERARVAETSEESALQERDRAVRDRDKAEAGEDKELQRANDLQLERDRLKEQLGQAQQKAESAGSALEAMKKERKKDAANVTKFREQAEAAAKRADELEAKLEAARKNPQVPQEVLDRIRAEAEEAGRKAAQAAGEAEMARYNEELEAARRELTLASPELAVFRARYARVQTELMELIRSVDGLPEDKRGNARRAMAALLERAGSECEQAEDAEGEASANE